METVCHVITKLELGGAQEVALYAVSHLDRSKFRPLLVTGPGVFSRMKPKLSPMSMFMSSPRSLVTFMP